VDRSGSPRIEHEQTFSYTREGNTCDAHEFLECTYTNALLVMKDGKIVSEIHRNNATPDSRFIAWSMTKSIPSILIACILDDDLIDSLHTSISDYLQNSLVAVMRVSLSVMSCRCVQAWIIKIAMTLPIPVLQPATTSPHW